MFKWIGRLARYLRNWQVYRCDIERVMWKGALAEEKNGERSRDDPIRRFEQRYLYSYLNDDVGTNKESLGQRGVQNSLVGKISTVFVPLI